jgi:hypothetical protein
MRGTFGTDLVEFQANCEKIAFVLDHLAKHVQSIVLNLVVIKIDFFELGVSHQGLTNGLQTTASN